jgi:hypothetical protein
MITPEMFEAQRVYNRLQSQILDTPCVPLTRRQRLWLRLRYSRFQWLGKHLAAMGRWVAGPKALGVRGR